MPLNSKFSTEPGKCANGEQVRGDRSPLLPIPVGDFTATSQHHQPGHPLALIQDLQCPWLCQKIYIHVVILVFTNGETEAQGVLEAQ